MGRAMSACFQWEVPPIPRHRSPRWWGRCLSLWFQLQSLPVVHNAQAPLLQLALSLNSYLHPIISNVLSRSIFFVPSLPWIRGHWRWTCVAYIQIMFSQWIHSVHCCASPTPPPFPQRGAAASLSPLPTQCLYLLSSFHVQITVLN